jgi:hypothetical protein
MTLATATRCFCGAAVTVSPAPMGQWSAQCPDCYDGTDDAGELAHVVGWAESPEEALWAWADALEEVSELALTPEGRAALEAFRAGERVPESAMDVVADLARDVSIEVREQLDEGWTFCRRNPGAPWLPFMPTSLDQALRGSLPLLYQPSRSVEC